ncbi:ankyrin repeat-containing domain protein [Tricladium varicosporioides]|nr:ankyrin repeat-containing domain protein [Hymenoscyphus varicosporioides]
MEGVDADVKDSNGRTPLWWAAGNGHLEIVKLLIEKEGINLRSKDFSGRTPLSWAAENMRIEVVKLLEAEL